MKKFIFVNTGILVIIFIMVNLFYLSGCKPGLTDHLEKTKSHLENIGKACKLYKENNGVYPEQLQDLVEKGLMKQVPLCPATGKDYLYFLSPDLFIIKCPKEDLYLDTGLVDKGFYPVFTSEEGLILKGNYTDVDGNFEITPTAPVEVEPTGEPVETSGDAGDPEPTAVQEKETEVPVLEETPEPVEISPEAEAHNKKGLDLMNEDKLDLALEEFNAAIAISPDYAEALKNIGNIYYYKDELDKAIEFYELSVEKDPAFWNGYNNIGNIYFDQGDLKKAEKYYLLAVDYCNGESIMPYNNLGDILIEQKRYEEALDNYSKAINSGLENGELYSQRGYCFWQLSTGAMEENNEEKFMEYINQALENLGKASEMDPLDPYPHFRAGIIYFNFGPEYFENALSSVNDAIDLAPENYTFIYTRGQIYHAKGELDPARKDYEKALEPAKEAGDSEMADKIEKAIKQLDNTK